MRVIKLSNRKLLRKELLRSFEKRFPAKLSADLHWQFLDKLIQDLPYLNNSLKSLFTEVSAKRSIMDYFQLQQFADPQKYRSAEEFYSSAAVLSFLKKFPFGKVADLDPLEKAKSNFHKAEKQCRITNRRLQWYRKRGYRHKNRWQHMHSIFHTARMMISGWLGPLNLNQIYDYTRHGPGGAVGVTGDSTTAYYKYAASRYSVSTRALPLAEAAILADPLWRRYIKFPDSIIGDPVPTPEECRKDVLKRLEVINYNKVTFVPKTAQTHRAIAIEPVMNIFLQLGIGDFMTQVLRRNGLNLRSQVNNQTLARRGSLECSHVADRPVTIDLSMASDTLSTELVRELLPEEWFNLLDSVRSHSGMLDDKLIPWAKFSSMGNGFTFQLESMIFYAISLSVAKHIGYDRRLISVYGDDIICPAGMSLLLIDALAYSGFSINFEKSYLTGNFRESCGSDWFEGRNTRPFFLKRKLQNGKDLVFLLNSFGGAVGLNDLEHSGLGLPFDNVRRHAFDQLPKVIRQNLLGPRTEDKEGHIHATWDFSQTSRLVTWNRDIYAWSFPSMKSVSLKYYGDIGPIVLQMMGSHGLTRTSNSDEKLNRFKYGIDNLHALKVVETMAAPVNSGVVTRRSSTKLRLATLTSTGWRND